jgi:putative transposase
MPNYRRIYEPGAYYFFTVVTHQRNPVFADKSNVEVFKKAISTVKQKHPFKTIALVVMPDHLHTIWRMPENDSDFSIRWQLIKTFCSRKIMVKPLWQNRFWEHVIEDETDLHKHLDYIYYNPVKHGYVTKAVDWPYSTFKREIELGRYSVEWGQIEPKSLSNLRFE